jgi:hypothetical protein
MNNNVIQPVGNISFDTIRKYFSLDASKDKFWQEMLADFQGIYSTIVWETDRYDTVVKTLVKKKVKDSCSVNFTTLKRDIEQDALLEEFEKIKFVINLKLIQYAKILKLLRTEYVQTLFKEQNYNDIFIMFKSLIPEDHRERNYLPYPTKEYQKSSNNMRVPFVKGSVISSRTTSNQFALVAAFKLLLYTESKIFKVFIYKKIKSIEDGKFDYMIIFNYGEIINFNEGLYLDCIKAICTFIITHLPANDDTINSLILVGQSMGGNMAVNTLVNLAREFQYPISKLYAICSAFPCCLDKMNLEYLNENLTGHYVSFMAMGENDLQKPNTVNITENSNRLTSKNISNSKVSLNSFYYHGTETPIKTLVFLYIIIDKGFKLSKNLYSVEDVGKIDVPIEYGIGKRIGSGIFHNLQLIFKGIKKILNELEPFEIQNGGKRKKMIKSKKQNRVSKKRHAKTNTIKLATLRKLT